MEGMGINLHIRRLRLLQQNATHQARGGGAYKQHTYSHSSGVRVQHGGALVTSA